MKARTILLSAVALYVARMAVAIVDERRQLDLLADNLDSLAQTMRERVYLSEWLHQDKPSPEAIAWMRGGR